MAGRFVPEPPVEMPPARTVHVPGRGEVFCRDTGGDGTPLLLLHGWTASADLNWFAQYGPLRAAGHRVIAVDHRGHGRGMRALADFRLTDCADDAVGVQRDLARRLGAPTFEAPGDHLVAPSTDGFTRALLAALERVQEVSRPPSTGSTMPVT